MDDNKHLLNEDYESHDEQLITLTLSTPLPPPPQDEEEDPHSFRNGAGVGGGLTGSHNPPPPHPPLQLLQDPPSPPSPNRHHNGDCVSHHPPPRTPRARGPSSQNLKSEKSKTVPPPYPWATEYRARVHPLTHLLSDEINIRTITGDLYCKRCDKRFEFGFDLEEKFREVAYFIEKNKDEMHDRAPASWMNPSVVPSCRFCKQANLVKPVGGKKKRTINWLFLFLGQMLGFCKLAELKYFCKHTGNHRTGAKDRVVYLSYIELYHQLDPETTFQTTLC